MYPGLRRVPRFRIISGVSSPFRDTGKIKHCAPGLRVFRNIVHPFGPFETQVKLSSAYPGLRRVPRFKSISGLSSPFFGLRYRQQKSDKFGLIDLPRGACSSTVVITMRACRTPPHVATLTHPLLQQSALLRVTGVATIAAAKHHCQLQV